MPPRGLDHLVLGVDDLDAAGAFYEKLGFIVGARNRHPWGTHNRIVQFPGTFLELITVGEPELIAEHGLRRFSFGAFVRDALARGEGFSMLVLDSTDAMADSRQFAEQGIGDFEPFFFERQALRPDGSSVRVAFTLAFTANPLAADAGFFVCQQHEPQNFWNPTFQKHPNGASGIGAVTMIAETPMDHLGFFRHFSRNGLPASSADGTSIVLSRGRIDLLKPEAAKRAFGHGQQTDSLAGYTVKVPELALICSRLERAHIPHSRYAGRVVIVPGDAYGAMIAFEVV